MNTATFPPLVDRFTEEFPKSRRLAEQAREVFPGGVTHDLRQMQPFPIYVDRAQGAYKWDVDGHRLIDYWSGHGALLLGHSHPDVVAAVQKQIERGTHPGACHELEIEWGRWVTRLIPSAEKARFVASGTEANLMALRLARLYTGKPKALKFAGHFHGWNDYVTPYADPPYADVAVAGIPEEVGNFTVVIPPGDPAAVDRTLAEDGDIGCVILEPTGGHMGQFPLRGDFLHALRELTTKHNRLLIFDEVVTGFRVHPGGAQAHYGVTPDMTTLAKVLAGGLPGGCVTGRDDIMSYLEFRPGKPKMLHPGTFNANPLSASAGVTALEHVSTGKPCRHANEMARILKRKLNGLFAERNIDWLAYGTFSVFKILTDYHGPRPDGDDFIPYGGDFRQIHQATDPQLRSAFRQALLLCGIDAPGFGGILTAAHAETDIEETAQDFSNALDLLEQDGAI